MEESNVDSIGLTTKEAINILCKDIEQVLLQYKSSQKSRRNKSWIHNTLHHQSQHSTINWISASFLTIAAISLIIAYILSKDLFLILESIFIFIFLVFSLLVELYDNKLRHNEIPKRIKVLLDKIRKETKNLSWKPENYPHLSSPFSPCITLQWTYRDNKVVNLPWALLVKDDVILIRPGQVSPGYCESLEKNSDYPLLHAKEIYGPTLQNHNEMFSAPKARKPLEPKKYKLLETPYINNLRIALEQALDRPITQQNQQRHLLMIKLVERLLLPTSFLIALIVNSVRYYYLEDAFGKTSAVDLFLMIPLTVVLPLLPLIFPIVWNMLNYLGMARFKILFESTTQQSPMNRLDIFEDEEDQLQSTQIDVKFDPKTVWTNFLDIFYGEEYILNRSSNILHVLGSVTALSCVDKKGILSWPNPTAEKVFFLHNTKITDSESLEDLGDLHVDGDTKPHHHFDEHHSDKPYVTIAEVLDITHDQSDPFKLHFDDTKWHEHLNSLKPLGLAILLNTCNNKTQDPYTQFCSHITCEAMYNENLVPVTNRRCLCELAREIGFVDEAQKIFNLENQLSSFRHLQPEMVRRDNKYARTLSLSTKLKFPFPHMFAAVVKELSSGSMQLLSQGTADIISDSCIDFWDGHDLCPLSPSDRKKIQDFYQRSSLTAYCTAFAYRPLSKGVSEKLGPVYLELPSDCRHLYHLHRSPTPIHWETKSVLEPRTKQLGQFYSTDSLLCNDSPQVVDVSDAEGLFEMQCNQIFIGMVTMQYQAQADMVQLIEQLERACIRFVHFSKENELRSRVFSEKMGLESGWNCHISLLSERNRRDSGPSECWANNGTAVFSSPSNMPKRNKGKIHSTGSQALNIRHIYDSNLQSSRTMSFSAPSAINMEHSVVKFDTEHETIHRASIDYKDDHRMSHDSIHNDWGSMAHDWQSLSCLTDSTEQSAPINFDMSNRAKLPRGIDKIRPHIELIDNVPLLVSLFTDCTAAGTREMLHIMQDYKEVVCVIGSSANCENIGIFMQADASIAVEPLYPQVCQKGEMFKIKTTEDNISPIELSRVMNSIACSLSIKRENPLCIYDYIMHARHYTSCLWNSVQFWLCCCISVTAIVLLADVLILPPILTTGQVMWICYIAIPLLSMSLMGIKPDTEIMDQPQGKNQIVFNMEVITFVMWCYGVKFLPVLLTTFVGFTAVIINNCMVFCYDYGCYCKMMYIPVNENYTIVPYWQEENKNLAVFTAQNFSVFLIVINFAAVSLSFVHRSHSIWNKRPFDNIIWLCTVAILLAAQVTYFLVMEYMVENFDTPSYYIICSFLSPIITFIVNEVLKREEIKANLRHQRRARLDFGTKLGMNSPF